MEAGLDNVPITWRPPHGKACLGATASCLTTFSSTTNQRVGTCGSSSIKDCHVFDAPLHAELGAHARQGDVLGQRRNAHLHELVQCLPVQQHGSVRGPQQDGLRGRHHANAARAESPDVAQQTLRILPVQADPRSGRAGTPATPSAATCPSRTPGCLETA